MPIEFMFIRNESSNPDERIHSTFAFPLIS